MWNNQHNFSKKTFPSKRKAFRSSAVKVIIFTTILIFIYQNFGFPYANRKFLFFFGLSAEGLRMGYFWQPLTHMFLHGGFLHIFFNMIMLHITGHRLAQYIGTKNFLCIYFLGGIFGGLLQALFTESPLIGASGGCFAVMLALLFLIPGDTQLFVLLYFIIPLKLRAQTFRRGLLVALILLVIIGDSLIPGVGHLAHLGGAFIGCLYIYFLGYHRSNTPSRVRRNTADTIIDAKFKDFSSFSSDLYSVLEKIKSQGMESLSKEELRLLEKEEKRGL